MPDIKDLLNSGRLYFVSKNFFNMKMKLMIKNTMLLLAAVCVSFVMSSCEGDEGPVGPQGPAGAAGAQGPKGDQGAPGQDGESFVLKSGKFEGTVTGTRQDGTEFSEEFSYEYTYSTIEAYFSEENDYICLYRFESLGMGEESPYIDICLRRDDAGLETEAIVVEDLDFAMIKEVNPNTVFVYWMDANEGEVELSDYVYDEETGSLSFNFTHTGTDNSTGNESTITGSFTTGEGKLYENIVYRKGN